MMSTHCTVQSIEIGSTTPTSTYLVLFLRGGGRAVGMYETIHLRRRQIFTIFDPYPPPVGNRRHSIKMPPPLKK